MTSRYIGLISGTSVDAVDAVLVEFSDSFKLLASHSEPIPDSLKGELTALTIEGNNEISRLMRADVLVGRLFSRAVGNLLDRAQVEPRDVQALGSHGQTIRHYPDTDEPSTLQIGDPNIIVQETGITTVADLRRRDMAAGGQGAPMVPAFHDAMFRSDSADRVIINIGGIGNITVLPRDKSLPVSGYDTGPGNALLDSWIHRHTNKAYDKDGAWASTGKVNMDLVNTMLDEPYFSRQPPKSTGREYFNLIWLDKKLSGFDRLKTEDVQASLEELTAITIVQSIDQSLPTAKELFVCGGGARNGSLMSRVQSKIGQRTLATTETLGLDPDWVEACAMAWLARQTLEGKAGNLPAVTGASEPVILGGIYKAQALA